MLSVIIAAYNEERRLPETLRKVAAFLSSRSMEHEIIVVDDGSVDSTTPVALELALSWPAISIIRYERNRGKGFALRTGVLASRGDRVLISDADLSTPIEEISLLLALIDENRCDVAIGSRALAMSMIIKRQPLWRQGMGRMFNRIVRFLVLDGFSDTQCGFKLFAGEIARRLFAGARIDRFAFDVEILALALQQGYRVQEAPIRWINSPVSTVHPVRDSLQMLKDLVRIRLALGLVRLHAPKPVERPLNPQGIVSFAPSRLREGRRISTKPLKPGFGKD